MIKKITLFLLIFIQTALFAQDWQDVRFSALTIKDGLSQLTVTTVLQDSKGMMWFGTRDGLNSYDGKSFQTYLFNSVDNRLDNHVVALSEDKEHNLWIGTTNGLVCKEFVSGTYKTYLKDKKVSTSLSDNYIFAIATDNQNRLIVGTKSGLNVYNKSKNGFDHYFFNGLLKENPIRNICISKDESIYIATVSQGILQLDKNFKLINQFKIDNQPKEKQVSVIFEDKSGLIWFGGINKGLCVLNPGNNTLQRFTINDGIEDNNNIRAIEDDGKGNLIIGTFNGLYLFNKATASFTAFSKLYIPGGEINHYSILAVKYDNAGTLWVGTYAGGVSNYHPNNKRFAYFNPAENNKYTGVIGMMVEDKNRNLWIASEGAGLIGWDVKNRRFSFNRIDAEKGESYSKNIIKSLFSEGDNIYCGTSRSEIFLFNTITRRFRFLYKLNDERKVVYDILKDNAGNLWAGATGDNNGLYCISKNGQIRSTFNAGNKKNYTFNDVRSLLLLRENVILVGTRFDGLLMFDYAKNSIKPILLNIKTEPINADNKHITALFKDSKNRIWIGTYGNGVYCYLEGNGVIAHFDKNDGLLDEDVCSIVESVDKNIWIASKSTISELNISTNKITTYNNKNGIYLLELSLRAAFKSYDGRLFFSGSNGFISFQPNKLSSNNFIPPVIFTSFSVNNTRVEVNDKTNILHQNLNTIDEIDLDYNQSNISIKFAALNYIFPEHNTYAIKLENVDREWTNIGSRNEMNYANLAPGTYTFMVKASNNDGIWNETPVSLRIHIKPPFWKTWWAYTIYILFFIAAFLFVVYYLKLKHNLEAKITLKQLEQEKSEEFHKERIQLFTNFSHEMRTPLTMILTPLIDLIDKSELLTPLYKESLQLMQKNANRLLLLVNQLMDFQKTESGKMKLNVSENDMVDFLSEIYLSFNELAKTQKITFSFDNSYTKLPAFFDENLFEKVCFNLISNAFKFSKENGLVKLGLRIVSTTDKGIFPSDVQDDLKDITGDLMLITVEDNGLGISEENLPAIFTPFYQVQASAKKIQPGSGIGLSLTRSIVKLSHGAIWATSELNIGTIFTVAIPISKANFNESEIAESKQSFSVDEQIDLPTMPLETQNQTVLIIDDDDDIRHFIARTLSASFKVLTAIDGKQGLEIATTEMPDIVLCDVMMPHITGIELCKKLKTNIKTGHIPIILITSRALSMQIQEGFNAGADEYITKPFRTSHLLLKINTLLQNRERLKSIYSKKFSLESLGIEVVSSDERFMTKINDIIQNNFSNQELDIDFIAGELGMSRTNLYRKVKSLTNLSTIDLIINIRLLTAKRMLMESDLSIAEIAYETGFNSPAYFTTSFKKQYGITPKEYIELSKKNDRH
jgi:signal transduction histidine kinase/ligand-binding sensor domain-containing protein/DNA-binding response OmpR family regulator